MTTKEEVLRLAEAAQPIIYYVDVGGGKEEPLFEFDTTHLTRLIDLAKQAGAAEEREACAKLCLDKRQLSCPEAINWNIALVSRAEAIRNRESKS